MGKSHIQKPVLYLPTRILVVPCDYDPEPKKVEWRQVVVRVKYDVTDWMRMNRPGVFVPRGIER